ncbi:family 78 glycoside hydrolase catalytic domain [Lactobacillus sp.]|uniref:alpha-L-rhamnosidase n=1 Tax=Lactobacillus sp. TaxID=1591 RepID=UPI003EF82F1A
MEITQILVNHMTEPVGFDLTGLRIEFSLKAEQDQAVEKRLVITDDQAAVAYDSGYQSYQNNYFCPDLTLKPRCRYSLTVYVRGNQAEVSSSSFFETGKMQEDYLGEWIGHPDKDLANTLFKKTVVVTQPVKRARLYATGLGVYEAYLDGKKIGQEFLAPGFTDYDKWVQVQTYDLTSGLKLGQHNLIFSLGDGWYKGNIGFDGGQENTYGDQQRLLAELHLEFADGSQTVVATDSSWLTTSGQITKSGIYYGEDLDTSLPVTGWQEAQVLSYSKAVLADRLSLPLTVNEVLPVKEVLQTPAGETVLDFGQNQAGLFEFYNDAPAGSELIFEMGEILQEGNFYRGNLRQARASFHYISDGKPGWVRPHFTYFGYRYVKVTGLSHVKGENFRAMVIYSQMPESGSLTSDNPLVNRLFANIVWGQKSNFFDVPTDCPQRDERLGWTGDANIFSNTAALNMNVFEFFKKYARDMACEQADHDGMLTMYAPSLGHSEGGAAVWGDASVTIPWNMYEAYGDTAILRQNYPAMKSWVDWIGRQTKSKNLWTGSFQFGDWLALDGEVPGLPTGKTEEDFVASAYYYYSSKLLGQSAALLGFKEDADHYQKQAAAIKAAIQAEYLTATGRLALDTQTAYALTLYFSLAKKEQEDRILRDLITRLSKDHDHLKTGFVGTPFICQALSEHGAHDLAVKLFLNEDYPSWLYAVKHGATTVWERWNSVLDDGKMNPEGMNSLNHYSFGAIMEWAYRYLLGLKDHTPGYQEVVFAPNFDYRFKQMSGHYQSSYGDLKLAYQIETDYQHTVKLQVEIPFGQTVHVKLPAASQGPVLVNGESQSASFSLTCGRYEISYQPDHDFIGHYREDSPIAEIMADDQLVEKLATVTDTINFFRNPDSQKNFGEMSLAKVSSILPFINFTEEEMAKMKQILTTSPLMSERTKA